DLFHHVEILGKGHLTHFLSAPFISGERETIKGALLIKDHEFQIERGKIKFSDPSEPTVHLKAHTEFDETRIDMNATGNLKKLEISFSSTPPLTQSEIL